MKFEDHWHIARKTMEAGAYSRAVDGMIAMASNQAEHNAAINLAINGKSPGLIAAIDKITGEKQED